MKIAIIHYSMYGHVATMSESVKKGVLAADPTISCDIYQVPETLPDDVLEKMYAPPKGDYPVITKEKMVEYDGFLFGVSGRFGMMSAQMRVRVVVAAVAVAHFPWWWKSERDVLFCNLYQKFLIFSFVDGVFNSISLTLHHHSVRYNTHR